MPIDLTIRAGSTARLECAAVGHPTPQIAWQKNGGTDFPAARERRMHVMPEDDVFFIVNAKVGDTGVYSCTAQNSAGSISANATLTVLGKCFKHTRISICLNNICLIDNLKLSLENKIKVLFITLKFQLKINHEKHIK